MKKNIQSYKHAINLIYHLFRNIFDYIVMKFNYLTYVCNISILSVSKLYPYQFKIHMDMNCCIRIISVSVLIFVRQNKYGYGYKFLHPNNIYIYTCIRLPKQIWIWICGYPIRFEPQQQVITYP